MKIEIKDFGKPVPTELREAFSELLSTKDIKQIAEEMGKSIYGVRLIIELGETNLVSSNYPIVEMAIKLCKEKFKRHQKLFK